MDDRKKFRKEKEKITGRKGKAKGDGKG